MKALYILTSTGKDIYIDLTYISVVFLLHTNPQVDVNIACDKESFEAIKNSNHPLFDLDLKLISVSTPEGKPSWRNRYVKCRMREIISGDFLYLDGDTIVRNSIHEIFNLSCSFAAASNHNTTYPSNFNNREKIVFESNNWTLPFGHYYNAGIMYWKDNASTRKLSDLYIQKWHQSSKAGIHFDQPALNSALIDWQGELSEFEGKYNAQFINDYRLSVDAVIWHRYLSGGIKYPLDYFELMLQELKNEGELSFISIEKVLSVRCALVSKSEENEKSILNLIDRKDGIVTKVDYYRNQTPILLRVKNKLLRIFN